MGPRASVLERFHCIPSPYVYLTPELRICEIPMQKYSPLNTLYSKEARGVRPLEASVHVLEDPCHVDSTGPQIAVVIRFL